MRRFGLFALFAIFAFLPVSAFANVPFSLIESDAPPELRTKMVNSLGEVENPPRSRAQARRRAKKAVEIIESVLRSDGYYQSQISVEYGNDEREANSASRTPVLKVSLGPQFKYGDIKIELALENNALAKLLKDELSLASGDPVSSAEIVISEAALLLFLKTNGFPDAQILSRDAVVDHTRQKMDLTLNFDAGDKATFGQVILADKSKVSQKWADMVAPFEAGDLYDETQVNLFKNRIVSTGAFANVSSELQPNDSAANAQRDLKLTIAQGKPNTISAEVGYSTTDGTGVDVTYERRNLGHAAQILTLTTTLKTNQQSVAANYSVPYAWRVSRALDFGAEFARQNNDVFRGNKVTAKALITEKISDSLRLSGGIGLETSKLREDVAGSLSDRAYLVEGISRAVYDSRDNILDPKKGVLIEGQILPTYDFGDAGFFTIAQADAATYYKMSESFTLAGRVKYGSIVGAPQSEIPLNKRFYGGGGGSVRGYGFQSISPENDLGTLVGGRSIVEGSAELRYQGTGNLGFVGFIDAASVSEAQYPKFEDTLFGLGAGVRYYTSFAPLRADIAIPLNRRDGDAAVQVYLSIGQSF